MKLGMNDREMILPCNGSQGAYINIENLTKNPTLSDWES